ncbi:unnamed protein product [Pleuronectes platessa]|uniref:Uncharacterized protein n=1 Tax=Pleuronectes platessa TaxID=8262 RepID=A0A9N7VEY4_PLEPL|nr:unnamed protein product [Pleuronectes platessa]
MAKTLLRASTRGNLQTSDPPTERHHPDRHNQQLISTSTCRSLVPSLRQESVPGTRRENVHLVHLNATEHFNFFFSGMRRLPFCFTVIGQFLPELHIMVMKIMKISHCSTNHQLFTVVHPL